MRAGKRPKEEGKTKGARSRERIVTEAIRLFAESGFANTSFQAIADACGISQASVFYHFEDKEALVRAVLEVITSSNHAMVSSSIRAVDGAETRLLKHFSGNLRWGIERREEAQVLILVYYLACFDGKFSDTYRLMLGRARERILEHVLAGVREGAFGVDAEDAPLVAEILHDALVGCFINAITVTRETSPGNADRLLKRLHRKWDALIDRLLK